MKRLAVALALSLLAAAVGQSAFAAARARYGGTLRAAIAGHSSEDEPSLADAPWSAMLLSMTASAICRLDASERIRPSLATELSWQGPLKLRVILRPGLSFPNGNTLSAKDVLASLARPMNSNSLSPYRALLFPLRAEGKKLSVTVASAYSLELPLTFAWPDLDRSLCHPSLAIKPASQPTAAGIGPFGPARDQNTFEANLAFPLGRPFADRLTAVFADERGAARLMALKQAQVAFGISQDRGPAPESRALYSTYLAFNPGRAGPSFRQSFEASIDRSDLTRFFVPGPSLPMHALLPPALMPQEPGPRPPAPAIQASRALTLVFDESLPEQRLVAERIQVKLHDLRYSISLKPVARAQLRARWAANDFDLMLHAVLLPPLAGPALAVAIDTAGRHDLLSKELPGIGAFAADSDRERAVHERAKALALELPLIPLYAQAVSVAASREVAGLERDGHGLPALDDAFLLPE